MNIWQKLPRTVQVEAFAECYPLPVRSRKKLTAEQDRQLDVDMNAWAERWFEERRAKRLEKLDELVAEQPQANKQQTRLDTERRMLKRELAENATKIAVRTKSPVLAEIAAMYRARNPENHRPLLILFGIEPATFGVN